MLQHSVELLIWLPRSHVDKIMEFICHYFQAKMDKQMNTYRLGYKQYGISCTSSWKVVQVVAFDDILLSLLSVRSS